MADDCGELPVGNHSRLSSSLNSKAAPPLSTHLPGLPR